MRTYREAIQSFKYVYVYLFLDLHRNCLLKGVERALHLAHEPRVLY
jgi:hypothetical protein